jgi:hypothetical protein
LLIDTTGSRELPRLALGISAAQVSEGDLQALIHSHPQCLPIAQIDALYQNAIAVCRELGTSSGPIDNLLITPDGLPVLVECKLWRNPQARREVVGQILDYAKELTRWTASDLQREVARRVEHRGNPLVELLGAHGHSVDEATFNDQLTRNLRLGRFLLLIVGDGIQDSVEAIAEYLQQHTGLHFTLGLVEVAIYDLEPGRRIVVPRVVLKTEQIRRTVIEVPAGLAVADPDPANDESREDDRRQIASEMADPVSRIRFWSDFVEGLSFDDPEMRLPKPGRTGSIWLNPPFKMPSAWAILYRSEARSEVGVNIKFDADSTGRSLLDRLMERWPDVLEELGGGARIADLPNGRRMIGDELRTGPWSDELQRQAAFAWLRRRANDFVNVAFPKLKVLAEELED